MLNVLAYGAVFNNMPKSLFSRRTRCQIDALDLRVPPDRELKLTAIVPANVLPKLLRWIPLQSRGDYAETSRLESHDAGFQDEPYLDFSSKRPRFLQTNQRQ